MKNVFKLLPAALGLLALASCNSDDFGTADKVDLTGKAVLEVVDGDDGQMRSFKTASLTTQWETGDVLRTYDGKMQEYYNFDYATSEGSSGKFVYNGAADLSAFDAQYVLYGVEAANMSYAGWKDGKNIALLKVQDTYNYKENEGTTTGYQSILPMLGKVTEIDKSGAKPQLKATMYTLVARAKVTFKNGKGANVKRVRARALKFNDGKDIEDVNFDKEDPTVVGNSGTDLTDEFSAIATEAEAPKLNGWFEAVLDKDITASTTVGGLQPCDEAVVNNTTATNAITVVVDPANMKDYTNCVFFPIAPADYTGSVIVFEYSTLAADETTDGTINWQYIGCIGDKEINRTEKFGMDDDELTIETLLQVKRDNIKNTEALTQLMADENNENAAVEITIDEAVGSEPLTTLAGAESQWTVYIPQLKNNMTVNIMGETDLTAHQLIIKDVAGANNSDYTVTFNFNGFKVSSEAIQINTTAKTLLTGDYTALPAASADKVAIDVVKTGGLTLGTTTESFKMNGKEIDVQAGDVKFVRGTINRLLNTAEGNTINIEGVGASTISRLNAGSNATVNIISGSVTTTSATGTSAVNISGGEVKTVTATQNATVTITGGEIATDGAISTTKGALVVGPAPTGETITVANNATFTTASGTVTIDAKGVTIPSLTKSEAGAINLYNGTIEALTYTDAADEAHAYAITVTSKGASAITNVTVGDHVTATYTSSYDATAGAEAVNAFGTAFASGTLSGYIPVYTAAQLASVNTLTGKAALMTEITALTGWASPNMSNEFNGNGKNIAGVDASLFGELSASVSNIKKLTVAISKSANTIGGLAKKTTNTSAINIQNVAIEGSIAAQNKVGGVIGQVAGTAVVNFGDGVTSGANANKNAVNVNVTFTNNTNYPGTMAYNPNAGTFGRFVGQVATGSEVDIKADCSVGSAAFSKNALHFDYNRILDGEGVIIYTFKGSDSDLIGYSPDATSLKYGGKTFTATWSTDGAAPGKLSYNATTKKVTGNVYYIGKAWNDEGAYVGLNATAKTAINTACGITPAADANWDDVNVYVHNVYVAAE